MKMKEFYAIKRVTDGKYLYGFALTRELFKGDFCWVNSMKDAYRLSLQQSAALISVFYTFDERDGYTVERFEREA